jgi:hypothetical protein
VQTFDYGHGASSRRADVPGTGMALLLQDMLVYVTAVKLEAPVGPPLPSPAAQVI